MSLGTLEQCIQKVHQRILTEEWADASDVCLTALSIDASNSKVHYLAGIVANKIGSLDKALEHFKKAADFDKKNIQYRYAYALNLEKQGYYLDAIDQYQICLINCPDHLDALKQSCQVSIQTKNFNLALKLIKQLCDLGVTSNLLNFQKAVTYAGLGEDQKAEMYFLKALSEQSEQDNFAVHFQYGLFLLSRERFEEGFSYYNYRFEGNNRNKFSCYAFPYPRWSGRFQKNSTLLIHGEQGEAFEILCASLFLEVIELAKIENCKIILAVSPSLVNLFQLSFSATTVVPHQASNFIAKLEMPIDFQISIGDLLSIYRKRLDDFEAGQHIYLNDDLEKTIHYSQKLKFSEIEFNDPEKVISGNYVGSKRIRIGLMLNTSDDEKIPNHLLERLMFLQSDVHFIYIKNNLNNNTNPIDFITTLSKNSVEKNDFLDIASLIANVDLIISWDSTIANLAGAMGIETWVVLKHSCDWVYGIKRGTSYWYLKTRYFHQGCSNDWTVLMDEIIQSLKIWIKQKKQYERTDDINEIKLTHTISRQDSINIEFQTALLYFKTYNFQKAQESYERALSADPYDKHVQWEYAKLLLMQERWGQGWDLYEARKGCIDKNQSFNKLPWPEWRGESLVQKTIVIHCNEDPREVVLFGSMLPDIISRKAHVVLVVIPKLAEIFRHSFPEIRVIAYSPSLNFTNIHALISHIRTTTFSTIDFHISIGSLGQWLRRYPANFSRQSYLRADLKKVLKMDSKLKILFPPQSGKSDIPLRVGFAWQDFNINGDMSAMTSKEIEKIIKKAKKHGWQCINLNNTDNESEAIKSLNLLNMNDYLSGIMDLTALMANLDLIICNDELLGHLSGALGLSTWHMVDNLSTWYWGCNRNNSVWYPNSRIFRQGRNKNWNAVIDEISNAYDEITDVRPI